VLRLCAVGLSAVVLWLSIGGISEHVHASGVKLSATSLTCSADLMSAYDSQLRARLRPDGTIQINDVIMQRAKALDFFRFRGQGPNRGLWIDVTMT